MNTLKKLSLALLFALPLTVAAAQRPATPFTDAEIDQLLAPIALYPDTVLPHVLIAATVPEDVEAAADWIDRHPDLRGQAAVDAVDRYGWDPSVKALVAFPEVIERMDEDPDWTEDLGLAFLEQEAVVMDRVQYLRDRAYDNGSLDDLEHVRVVREREYIYLEPAVSRVVYVPYYDPWVVYGNWWWPAYPPYHWTYWAGHPVRHYYGSRFWWGVSFHVGPSWYPGRFNWAHRHVVVTRPHRHYAPSPGYSGRSSMRRERIQLDARQARRAGQWRHAAPGRPDASRRDSAPVRRGHDRHNEGERHVPQGNRQRRSWTEVRAGLTARRDAPRADSRRVSDRVEPARGNGGSRRGDTVYHGDRPQRSGKVTRSGDSHGNWLQESRRPDDSNPRREVRSEQGRSESRRQDSRARSHEPRVERPVARAPQPGAARSEPRQAPRVESRGESRGGGESRGSGRGQGGDRGVRSR